LKLELDLDPEPEKLCEHGTSSQECLFSQEIVFIQKWKKPIKQKIQMIQFMKL